MHRFFLLVLPRDFPRGRAYFISPRIGRTYPGPPPEVEGLMIILLMVRSALRPVAAGKKTKIMAGQERGLEAFESLMRTHLM
jgi:hypothetical protein